MKEDGQQKSRPAAARFWTLVIKFAVSLATSHRDAAIRADALNREWYSFGGLMGVNPKNSQVVVFFGIFSSDSVRSNNRCCTFSIT